MQIDYETERELGSAADNNQSQPELSHQVWSLLLLHELQSDREVLFCHICFPLFRWKSWLCSGSCKEHYPHPVHMRYRRSYLLQSSCQSYQVRLRGHLSYIQQPCSPTPSTTADAPELRTAKRSPATPLINAVPLVAP